MIMNNTTKTKMNISLSILAFSLASSNVSAQTCAEQPTCEDLGYFYTTSECTQQAVLKCPFDDSLVYCSAPTITTKYCSIGDIVYSDGKCYKKPAPLVAKGIVFDNSKKKMIVGGTNTPDPLLPGIFIGQCAAESGGDSSPLVCGHDEKTCITYHEGNTNFSTLYDCAPRYLSSDQYRPFTTANAKKAYIANLSELYKIYQNKDKISQGCSKAGINCYLSSTQIGSIDFPAPTDGRFWVLNFTSGKGELINTSTLTPVLFLSSY